VTRYRFRPVEDAPTFVEAWVEACKAADVALFSSPAWIAVWLDRLPPGVTPWALYRDDRPLGLFGRTRGPFGGDRVLMSETGHSGADAIYAEDLDFLLPEQDQAGRIAAMRALLRTAGGRAEIVVRNATRAASAALVRAAADADRRLRVINRQTAFSIDLDGVRRSGAGYVESLGPGARRQIRRSRRLYEERGPLTLEIVSDADAFDDAWTDLVALHGAAWRARGREGVFANDAVLRFHRDLVAVCARRPEFGLSAFIGRVRAGDDLIGCLYHLAWRGRVSNYQTGFRFEADNRLKPGLVSHAMMADYLIDAGERQYDLLAGGDYKSRLAFETRPATSFVVERRSAAAIVTRSARALKFLVRR